LLKVGRIQISLSGVALLTCMPSVGAWRRLGECSTSCHLEILSLGMPCFKDMPRMGVVRKLLKHFDQMCEEGVQPNDITFHSVLSACSCGGLVDEGWRCYASMSNHSQTPFRVCLL
jgi:pentatricopeptide repeat protein